MDRLRALRGQGRTRPLRTGRLRRLLSAQPKQDAISVVVVCYNEKTYLERTVRSLCNSLPATAEVIVVDDQSDDGCCDFLERSNGAYGNVRLMRSPNRLGVSGARNLGAGLARGDFLIFSDAHVEVPAGWVRPIVEALSEPRVGAVVPAISVLDDPGSARGYGMRFSNDALDLEWLGKAADVPYPIPLTCGCFVAMRRAVFEEMQGFDRGMVLYGSEDIELSLQLWLRGYECRVLPQVTVAHRFTEKFLYRVDWEPLYNRLRMGLVHLGPKRWAQLLTHNLSDIHINRVWDKLMRSDIWARRDAIHIARQYDDDWYFDRFSNDSA